MSRSHSVRSKASSNSYEALSSLSTSPRPAASTYSAQDARQSKSQIAANYRTVPVKSHLSNDSISEGSKGSKYIWDDFDEGNVASGRDRMDSDISEDTSYFSFPSSSKSARGGSTGAESLQALVQEVTEKVNHIKVRMYCTLVSLYN